MTTYAITAATGQLGRLVVTDLVERGVAPGDVVAIVRDPAKARWLKDAGVQVRAADYEEPEALRAALAGTDRLLLISSNSFVPGQRAVHHANAIEAAAAAGVGRIVYTSLLRADTNTMPLGQDHRTTEQHLHDSGVPTLILRNGWYVENFTEQLDTYRQIGAVVGAAGKTRIAPVSRADLAAAAASALLDATVDTATYELAGPSVTFPEIADALSQVTGQQLPYRDVTLEEYRAGLLAAGLDEATAGFVTALEAGMANGDLDSDSTDLERLLGRPATDLRTTLTGLVANSEQTLTRATA